MCLPARGLFTVAHAEFVRAQDITAVVNEEVAARRGGPGSVIRTNLPWPRDGLGWNILYGGDMPAAFLVGVAAGRHGVLSEPGRYPHGWCASSSAACRSA